MVFQRSFMNGEYAFSFPSSAVTNTDILADIEDGNVSVEVEGDANVNDLSQSGMHIP